MPEDGIDLTPRSNLLSTAEITRLASLFASSGVTKIRLTGGEPTLRPDLTDIVASVASLPGIQHVGLTTNGLTLAKHLPELKAAGLNLLNISLDTLKPGRFEEMTRRKGHDRVLKSIYTAIELGYNPVKLNVVVMSGVNDDEISDFVRLTKDLPVNVRFIEYMPFDGNVWKRRKMVGYKEMRQCIEDYLIHGDSNSHSNNGGATSDDTSPSSPSPPHSPDLHFKKNHTTLERLIDPVGEVAKNFQIPGHAGTISFITSMTSAFCSDCNRVRIMADGNLKVCLFGANEVSLRDAMREGASDEQLRQVISVAVDKKRAAHAGMFELAKAKNRAMIKIGG
jgi:cyclic pyranopterin phosphate synthase